MPSKPPLTPPLATSPPPLAELLLRRRSLNVLADDAYGLHHGIAAREVDTVTPAVANLQPGDTVGEQFVRSRRVSIVLVHKLAAPDADADADPDPDPDADGNGSVYCPAAPPPPRSESGEGFAEQ